MEAKKLITASCGLLAILALGACGTVNDPMYGASPAGTSQAGTSGSSYPVTRQAVDTQEPRTYAGYGVVHSVERVSQEAVASSGGGGIGLGTVAGAVVGGLAGSQIGSGSGATAATVIGAAGGAYVGHEIENRQPRAQAQPDLLKVTVRMSDGSYQAVLQPLDADLRVGDRVRVGEGVVQRY